MASPKINIDYLSNVHYQHPDLASADKFLQAFGLISLHRTSSDIYYRGYGNFPFCYIASQSPDTKRHFLGPTFALQSLADLQRAAQLPGASPIQPAEGPNGGQQVLLHDPAGEPIRVTYGQERLEPLPTRTSAKGFNWADEKHRGAGEFQRFQAGPSAVHKLGHFGRAFPEKVYKTVAQWYLDTFNLMLSDAITNPASGDDELLFLHIDKGDDHTDHHTFFLASNPDIEAPFVHHSSFEVLDMDSELLGHKHLEISGYTNCWGVGRHILGSQIFDYWFDPSGNIIEHYADGDLVNRHHAVTREPAGPNSLAIWGPNVPLTFLTGKPPGESSAEPDVVNAVPAKGIRPDAQS